MTKISLTAEPIVICQISFHIVEDFDMAAKKLRYTGKNNEDNNNNNNNNQRESTFSSSPHIFQTLISQIRSQQVPFAGTAIYISDKLMDIRFISCLNVLNVRV